MIAQERRGRILSGLLVAAGLTALGAGQAVLENRAEAQGAEVQAPRFEVDPFWPKPLPNNWLLGSVIGVWADDQDNVWIIHRSSSTLHNNEKGAELNPPIAECCRGAPPVLVFDQAGNLVRSWGGPGDGSRSRDEMRALEALGLESDVDFDAVKAAWRKLAKENHPDVRPGDADAAVRFQAVQAAYEVLRAAEERREWRPS